MCHPVVRAPVLAIILFLACALVARSVLQIELGRRGFDPSFAADLSYLIVPPVLLVLMWPILRNCKAALLQFYAAHGLAINQVMIAIAIGVLARAAYWCALTFAVSTGIVSAEGPGVIEGPEFAFRCPPLHVMLVGMLVWLCLVPFTEEIVHRGLVQSSLMQRGRRIAIIASALVFTIFHSPASMPVALPMGIVFAIQFDRSASLWPCTLSHAMYDGLTLLDWQCLRGNWNPPPDTTPIFTPAILGGVGLVIAVAAITWLLGRTGAHVAPRPDTP